ncbi:FliH/SctL family protein [Roseovarius indicus]|uniref:FliH/SctL family protein n=1 Tax=Roseovarius indicus TaxID=540747 RepID=UPI0007D9E93E|nr:hypothetical protein [Roseovarius indicus]OAN98642.1 hypothetical protein A8B76_00935 [Roseovarius indicus]
MIDLFQRNFDLDDDTLVSGVASGSRTATEPDIPDSMSMEMVSQLVEDAKANAYAEGFADGETEAAKEAARSLEASLASTAEEIRKSMEKLIGLEAELRAEAELEISELVQSICSAVFPRIVASRAAELAVTQVISSLKFSQDSPILRVQVEPALADEVERLSLGWKTGSKRNTELSIEASAGMEPGRVRMDWLGGGLEYDLSVACERVEKAFQTATDELRAQIERSAECKT